MSVYFDFDKFKRIIYAPNVHQGGGKPLFIGC